MSPVFLELWNHKTHVEAGIKSLPNFQRLVVLKELFQSKAAAAEERQIPNKPPLTENESTKKKNGENLGTVIFLRQQEERRSNFSAATKN